MPNWRKLALKARLYLINPFNCTGWAWHSNQIHPAWHSNQIHPIHQIRSKSNHYNKCVIICSITCQDSSILTVPFFWQELFGRTFSKFDPLDIFKLSKDYILKLSFDFFQLYFTYLQKKQFDSLFCYISTFYLDFALYPKQLSLKLTDTWDAPKSPCTFVILSSINRRVFHPKP